WARRGRRAAFSRSRLALRWFRRAIAQRRLHGVDDGVVAGAAAVVARQKCADVLAAAGRALAQELGRGHEHAWRAEPALQGIALDECLLQVGDLAAVGEALDGDDLGAIGLHGEHQAAAYDGAIDAHRAGPAHAVLAAQVRAREPEIRAQEVDEVLAHGDGAHHRLAVDSQPDLQGFVLAHAAASVIRLAASARARR